MKILVFADLHGMFDILDNLKSKSKDVDMIISAGDHTFFGKNEKKILKKISEFNKPVLILHGNHEEEEFLKKECNNYENLIFMHKASFRKENIIFFGYGGGGFATVDSEFRSVSKHFSKDILNDDKTVLILHGPPADTNVDVVAGKHVGNKDFTKFIKKQQLDLVVCGHIHDTEGLEDKIGKTRIINPGPLGKIIEL